jgi:hypothetical protein
MRGIRTSGIAGLCVSAAVLGCAGLATSSAAAEAPAVPPPPNDALAGAQAVHSFPATISGTTVGATIEANESESGCGVSTYSSVWYSVRPATAERIAIDLAAGGALDGTIDVFHAVRSQLSSVACEQTDSEGKASLSFAASKNGLYYIRVAALRGSQLAAFTLDVFLPTPAVEPPGHPLPPGGASGQVDRIQNINAAYSVTMHSGVSYLINLANRTEHACVSGTLFAPCTKSFEEGSSLLSIGCGGYRLFTPGPGQGGRYSLELTPRESHSGVQRFHLQVAVAGAAETAPGLPLANYAHAHGYLDGGGVRVLRLYRLDVTSHSNLTLRLHAPESARFNLALRDKNGRIVECQCEGSGPQTLQHQLNPGRYYAVVSERGSTSGSFTLVRESRTITSTGLSFSSSEASAGQPLSINVKVSPEASGPVTVDIERFDPVFGWQFYAERHASASGGAATVPFTPPAVGRWRAKASYGGSRVFSPSSVGFSYLLVS